MQISKEHQGETSLQCTVYKTRKQVERLAISSGKLEIKETCCPKMGTIKDTKVRGLVDTAEKRWKDTEDLYKKDSNEPDCYEGAVSHTEPDILECEVKWALGSTAANKASGCDEIPVELFNTLKDDAIQMVHSTWQQIRPSSGHRTGKGQSSS